MSEENKPEEESNGAGLEDKANTFINKVVQAGNKKYGFNFEIHGWIIGIVSILLLVLILK